MHPEVEELRPKLKEILYDCAVEIRATKAALYVFDGTSRYELVTEYGFRGGIRQSADENDALVDRCGRGRTPFFVNGLAAEPRLSPILFEASTDRLLVAPLYSRGKLIGFVDMRDKAAKAPFEQTDVPKALEIAGRLVELFADKNIFGHRFIALSNVSGVQASTSAAEPIGGVVSPAPPVQEMPNASPPSPRTAPDAAAEPAAPRPAPIAAPPLAPAPRAHVPRLATIVIEARTAASRIFAPAPESFGEDDMSAVRDVLRSILLIPGAVATMFSAFGHMGGVQEIAARSTILEEAKNLLQSKLSVWLTKRGDAGGFVRTSVSTPFGISTSPVTGADIQKVFTAALSVGSLRGLYLTVAFAGNPDRAAHELLAVLHSHVQLVLEHSIQRTSTESRRMRIAEKLVEPDFAKYPELRRHSDEVASLSAQFARVLNWSPQDVEQARMVAVVHDAGMRLLDYERLYRKHDLTQEELGFLREHPSVGAAIVEPFLGAEIARAVLCHHERVDGRGYPNELHGDDIPLISRLVQICDAWVAMTDRQTYQSPENREDALATLSRAAGSQFDAELTRRFVEMMRGVR